MLLHGGKFSVFSSPDFCINTPGKALFDRAEACLESNQSRSEPSTAQRCIWIVSCLLMIFFSYVISQELKTVSLVQGILIWLSTIFINFVSLFAKFTIYLCFENTHRISSYSFRGNYSFLNLEIQRSQNIRPEYINVRKLFKGGNYSRVETI